MMAVMTNDVDYVAARLHGRRSRFAEGSRLDEMCHLRSLTELSSAAIVRSDVGRAGDFQRAVVKKIATELKELRQQFIRDQGRLLDWMFVRFQLEDLKVVLRGYVTRTPAQSLRDHLLEPSADIDAFLSADSLAAFAERIPHDALRESLKESIAALGEDHSSFVYELALDRGYFRDLSLRANALSRCDGELINPLVRQEIDAFHLALIARGRFFHQLTPELLLPFHIDGTAITTKRFAAMLDDPDLATAAKRAIGIAIDVLPPSVTASALESCATNRLRRLANQAFRRDPTGIGAVVGFIVLRRIEAANLITLSEGIRLGIAGDALRARMIPRSDQEAAHV